MSLAARITRCPRPFDPDRAAEIASDWPDIAPEARDLLVGAGATAPHLHALMTRERDWLAGTLDAAPEDSRDAALDAARTADMDQVPVALRRAKRRLALLTALCDLGGVWPLETVTDALTRLADLAVSRALEREVAAEIRRGRLGETGRPLSGLVALAMGKMGAFELNYSSDIDLILLFDEDGHDDPAGARAAFVKAARRAMAILSQVDADGYVFRTDLRLRPDPSVTPIVLGMEAAERYYESLGRTWERAAHIKARPAAGDLAAGETYLDTLRPFIWRRHLDFAAIEDAHAMRQRIRDHKGLTGPITLPGHDMKLGRGGIREIEFFTQTRQIIAGGRDPSLRVRGTVAALDRLAAAGWVPRDVADRLTDDYRAHREVEHRLQMIGDRQTHALPETPAGFARLAALMDAETDALRRTLSERLGRVSHLTEPFFAPRRADAAPPEVTLSESQAALVEAWRALPALRSPRALEIFERVRPGLLARLLDAPRPDRALVHFDGFLRRLPAGVQLFSMFEANPSLIDLLVDVFGTTPDLAAYLAQNAAVLDAVIGGGFFAPWPGREALETELAGVLERADDYERQLDATRRWSREIHFRIGVHHLRGLVDAMEAGAQYCDLARATIAALWPAVEAEFARKHGPPPGRGAVVLAMGSLGAGHLTARSDLDLIVIYDAAGATASDGPRPLAARTYYARLTQSLVTALSAQTAEGRLYAVDMRLRPSGKQGPVATSLSAFDAYQKGEAWTWEHLALTRGDVVAGPDDLSADVAAVRADVLAQPRDAAEIRADTASMVARLRQAHTAGAWEVKSGPGGLQEVELIAACLALIAGADPRDPGVQIEAGALAPEDADALRAAHERLRRLQTSIRLLTEGAFDPVALGASGVALVLRETGAADMETLAAELDAWRSGAASRIDRLLA